MKKKLKCLYCQKRIKKNPKHTRGKQKKYCSNLCSSYDRLQRRCHKCNKWCFGYKCMECTKKRKWRVNDQRRRRRKNRNGRR